MATTVLLADDDRAGRLVFRRVLEYEGYKVIEANDGLSALEALKNERIDLLLTDIVMPGLDGIELLERARQLQPELRAIVMTGHKTNEAVIGAFRNKACDFLSKPFHVEE